MTSKGRLEFKGTQQLFYGLGSSLLPRSHHGFVQRHPRTVVVENSHWNAALLEEFVSGRSVRGVMALRKISTISAEDGGGTGTSARLALMHHEGRIKPGDRLETVSLRGSGFIGEFIDTRREEDHEVVENTITGKSYVLAHSRTVVNCEDPMVDCGGLHHIHSDGHD